VVVDDAAQGVTEVVRGTDLRGVTATHIRLQQALGLPRPGYAHLGLVTGPDGARLGKRDGALGLALLAHRGIGAARVLGWLGWSLGCVERAEPAAAADLVAGFSWARVAPGPVAVPPEWCG
jgi:glutamyl/glutaminyl-tRNA synthetase